MTPPFIVFALPRSRTAWLAQFLSYRDWACSHDEIRHARSMDDIRSWFSQSNTGTAETAAAPWWRTVQQISPDIRVLIVRRPVQDVVDSLMRLGLPFDRDRLTTEMERLDRKLDQIERRMKNVLSVSFYDLADEDVCKQVFEHCLPHQHDPAWWERMSPINIQVNMHAITKYMIAHQSQLKKLAGQVKCLTIADMARKPYSGPDDLVISQVPFDTFDSECHALIAEHASMADHPASKYESMNRPLLRAIDQLGGLQITTAKCNGRLVGYLMSHISPSVEFPGQTDAIHSVFFASPDFKGLGRQLQLSANAALRERGVNELYLRAGLRGSGPYLGPFYERLGAEPEGQLYRLHLN